MSEHVWDQQPNEPARWFRRFTDFCLRGPSRRMVDVWKAEGSPGQHPSRHWNAAKIGWKWDERAAAYDAWTAEQAIERAEAERVAEDRRWAERRRQQREDEWELRNALLEKFKAMSRFPLQTATTTDTDGRQVTIMPVRWTFSTMVAVSQAIGDLGRLAAGMEQEAVGVDITSGGDKLPSVAEIIAEVRRSSRADRD